MLGTTVIKPAIGYTAIEGWVRLLSMYRLDRRLNFLQEEEQLELILQLSGMKAR